MRRDLRRTPYPQQVCGKSGIGEVYLRRLHEPLAEVPVVGAEREYDVARLQHGQPLPDGSRGHPSVVRDGRRVEQLPDAAGQKTQEGLECAEVPQVRDLPDIALDVCPEVVAEEVRRLWPGAVAVQPGQEAAEDPFVACPRHPRSRQFRYGKRKQFQQAGAAGEGLGHRRLQRRLVAARQDVQRVRPPLIGLHLEVGQQIRRILDFAFPFVVAAENVPPS